MNNDIIQFDTVFLENFGGYNLSNSVFTATKQGFYMIICCLKIYPTDGSLALLTIKVNDNNINESFTSSNNYNYYSGYYTISINTFIWLNINDYFCVILNTDSINGIIVYPFSFLSIYL
jgi:hypothetical protein